ncbi:hypothetical protein [Stenotrophomonas sp. ATs4]|uniref:hypothetical protein n=1 Tax=Stenotrophomonas sp. ATs4 TaxID=3402766 RepID=UPI003F6E6DCF
MDGTDIPPGMARRYHARTRPWPPGALSVAPGHARRAQRQMPGNPRKNRLEKSEFRFTETLSAATILVPQAIALDATETDKNSVARVDIAEMAVFLSITCCNTTRHREPTSKPPTSAPPRCVRFLCSYLLPNQQVRDEPACKQQTLRNSSKPAPAQVRVFSFQDLVSDATTMNNANFKTWTSTTTTPRGGCACATHGASPTAFP